MTEAELTNGFPSRRLLRFVASGVLALLFALLTLGAIVTSFHVGMADPVWPTRPWHLLTISWDEPSPGFLIEHAHRAAGFITGGAVALLALLAWLTERRPVIRWLGIAALLTLLSAFGQLHGSLLTHQRVLNETGELTSPDWGITLGPTTGALALEVTIALISSFTWAAGGRLRLTAILLLIAVMLQGILGGLRVYLNALYGGDLAAVHGVFSQAVLAVAVAVVVLTGRQANSPPVIDRGLNRLAGITAAVVFLQIVAGAILRHTDSPLGPRLHLLGAFLVIFSTAAVARRSRGSPVRGLAVLASSLAGIQVLLGVEAWMIRFQAGFNLSAIQTVTQADAVVRTLHALVGYGLFAATVALAAVLLRDRESTDIPARARRHAVHEEALV